MKTYAHLKTIVIMLVLIGFITGMFLWPDQMLRILATGIVLLIVVMAYVVIYHSIKEN